jgi:hypothetical protein
MITMITQAKECFSIILKLMSFMEPSTIFHLGSNFKVFLYTLTSQVTMPVSPTTPCHT